FTYYPLTLLMSKLLDHTYSQIGDLLDSFSDAEMKDELGVILITHLLPDRFLLLNALSKLSTIVAVIPKPKSIHQPTLDKLEDEYHFEFLTRHQIAETEIIDNLLLNSNCQKFILLDIGGYFAPIID